MVLQKISAISGLSGLYKIVSARKDGVMAQSLENGQMTFASQRKHQYNLLASIGIYTEDDNSIPLYQVFKNMMENPDVQLPDAKAPAADYQQYFGVVLPNYDRERVHGSDMKKMAKWYSILQQKGLLTSENLDEVLKTLEKADEGE